MNTPHALRIPVYGLGCGGGGAGLIERELARLPGTLEVYVNPATEIAYVQYDPSKAGPAQFAHAIEQAGYRAGQVTAG